MIVIRNPIKSVKSEANPQVWFDIAETSAGIDIGKANFQGVGIGVENTSHAIKGMLTSRSASLASGKDLLIVAVKLDGTLVVEEPGESGPEYLAHLGFYHKSTDTLELLEFTEG